MIYPYDFTSLSYPMNINAVCPSPFSILIQMIACIRIWGVCLKSNGVERNQIIEKSKSFNSRKIEHRKKKKPGLKKTLSQMSRCSDWFNFSQSALFYFFLARNRKKIYPRQRKNKHCYVLVELLRGSDLNCHGNSCKIRMSFGFIIMPNNGKIWVKS